MKVLIAQINTIPRDFTNNLLQIYKAIEQAHKSKVDLVVTPELSIPGYSVKDLIYDKKFIDHNLDCLHDIIIRTKVFNFPYIVVGYIDKNHTGYGKSFKNMAAVIKNGKIITTYQKQLLPFYDVFDEGRYFEPGHDLSIFEINGEKWGLAICEDVWNDKGSDDYSYHTNPLAKYREIGIKNIISINSSPFVQDKPLKRYRVLRNAMTDGTLIYVNQIGGQDDLVFDGHSFVIKNGTMIYGVPTSQEISYDIVDTDNTFCNILIKEYSNSEKNMFDMLVLGLKDYITKSGFKSVVIGSSGGIDSAVVIALASEAIGAKNVHAIRMPSLWSSEHSKDDALQLHKNIGCNDYLLPINHIPLIDSYNKVFTDMLKKGYNAVANQNMQARIRGTAIMHFSNAFGSLPLATGNKSELSVGYCTLYGDCNGGLAPLGDVYKMEVYTLARYYNKIKGSEIIPISIIEKAPSAELAPNQKDTDNLLPYPILDVIIKNYVEEYISDFDLFKDHITNSSNRSLDEWFSNDLDARTRYKETIKRIDKNEFKRRQLAPVIKIHKVAFGTGRRMPIVKGE